MDPVSEHQPRELLVHYGRFLFIRGYSSGNSDNLNIKSPDGGYLVTPTNSCLNELDPVTLSRLDANGVHLSSDKSSKEMPIHLVWYWHRPSYSAAMYLHPPRLTVLSCLPCPAPENYLPLLAPYYVMCTGQLSLLPYFKSGHKGIASALSGIAADHTTALLTDRGPIISGRPLCEAMSNVGELEDSARIRLTLKPLGYVPFSEETVTELRRSR